MEDNTVEFEEVGGDKFFELISVWEFERERELESSTFDAVLEIGDSTLWEVWDVVLEIGEVVVCEVVLEIGDVV